MGFTRESSNLSGDVFFFFPGQRPTSVADLNIRGKSYSATSIPSSTRVLPDQNSITPYYREALSRFKVQKQTQYSKPFIVSSISFNSNICFPAVFEPFPLSPCAVSGMSISTALSFKLSTFSSGGGSDSTTIKLIGTRTFVCFNEIINIESRLKLTSPASICFHRLTLTSSAFTLHCVRPDSTGNTISSSLEGENGDVDTESRVLEIGIGDQEKNNCGGGGGDGGDNEGGGSFGGGDGGEGDNEEEREFGPILKFEDVMKEAEARGVELPSDMMEAAKSTGIRKLFLLRYLDLQESVWPLGFLIKYCSMLRNRMLADPSFLFKVGTEVVIDSCCATFAEMKQRGKDFWSEFELFLADLLVGVVVDIALVGMLAPYARFGQQSASRGLFGRLQHASSAFPSSVFEAERPGCKFSVKQRIATYFYKGVLYGSVGFSCGLVGQGIANLIMTAKRSIKKSDEDIPVPPLVKSAALWGVFLAVSSNTRYQIINGLERLVEASPVAKQVPQVAMAFTVGVRFANNIYGGMQFVDWAKWSGVQ